MDRMILLCRQVIFMYMAVNLEKVREGNEWID